MIAVHSLHAPRRGAALLVVLVALTLITTLMVTVGSLMVANRRLEDRRAEALQATWLARAGADLALARLLERPEKYPGETVEPIAQGKVEVTVKPGDEKDTFQVTSEARYPADRPSASSRTVTLRVRRTVADGKVRVEVLPPKP
ncbi:MAG: hypothetical protein U0736_25115 [Gemmataceae bacterium]